MLGLGTLTSDKVIQENEIHHCVILMHRLQVQLCGDL